MTDAARDLLNLLVASDLPPTWRALWLFVFTLAVAMSLGGVCVFAELVLDETLRPWIAKQRTRAFRRSAGKVEL